MKEITTYGDQYGKWYEVKGTDGYCKTFKEYQHAKDYYEESEEDKIVRLAREKAIERNKRIDSILG